MGVTVGVSTGWTAVVVAVGSGVVVGVSTTRVAAGPAVDVGASATVITVITGVAEGTNVLSAPVGVSTRVFVTGMAWDDPHPANTRDISEMASSRRSNLESLIVNLGSLLGLVLAMAQARRRDEVYRSPRAYYSRQSRRRQRPTPGADYGQGRPELKLGRNQPSRVCCHPSQGAV